MKIPFRLSNPVFGALFLFAVGLYGSGSLAQTQTKTQYDERVGMLTVGAANSLETLIENLVAADRLSSKELVYHLDRLKYAFSHLINSRNRQLWTQYAEAINKIGMNPKFANTEVIQGLVRMEMQQNIVFGNFTTVSYWESAFDTSALSSAVSGILKQLSRSPDILPGDVVKQLVAMTDHYEDFSVDFNGVQIGEFKEIPKMSQDVCASLYEYAIRKNLIQNASSLKSFITNVALKILDNTSTRSSVEAFLSSQFGYTLSVLKTASDSEVLYILSNLKQMNSAIAYEELVRSGRLARMNVEQILQVLKLARTYANYYEENPQFGEYYTKLGKDMAQRIQRVNLSFAKQFANKSPTSEQVDEFKRLSGFGFGQYTMARIQSPELSKRDYEVGMKLGKDSTAAGGKLQLPISTATSSAGLLCHKAMSPL